MAEFAIYRGKAPPAPRHYVSLRFAGAPRADKKLFNADNADEWMNIFRFLGVGPMEDLTMDDVKASFDLASTHSKGRNETVSNFIKVENDTMGGILKTSIAL